MNLFKNDLLKIICYSSYGNNESFFVSGRVLDEEHIKHSKTGFLSSLLNSFKRFETDEHQNIELLIEIAGKYRMSTMTDQEGYFHLPIKREDELSTIDIGDNNTLSYQVSFKDNPYNKKHIPNINDTFNGEIYFADKSAKFAIVSDVDDTILSTGVLSFLKLKLLFNTFFIPSSKRLSFSDTSDVFQKLSQNNFSLENDALNLAHINPMFYLSNSPWNLYEYLNRFLSHNEFPTGPVLLRDFSLPFETYESNYEEHKELALEHLLNTYPQLKFILIGDASEHDPIIYTKFAKQFPQQIQAVFIREVNSNEKNQQAIDIFSKNDNLIFKLIKDSNEIITELQNSHLKNIERVNYS